MQKTQVAARVAFLSGVLIVTWLSLLPREDMPNVGVSDKLLHMAAYAALTVPGIFGFQSRRSVLFIAAGLLALGCILEIAQTMIPGRNASIFDASANGLGIALGLIAAWAAQILMNRHSLMRR